MDATRFDALSRALSTMPSRRGALRLLAGSTLSLLAWHGIEDAIAHDARKTCKKKSGKAKKKCLKKAKKHNAQHTLAAPPPQCTGSTQLCGSNCVDVLTDANHCGGCNQPCTPESPETCGETGACAGGTCTLHGVETVCRTANCEGSFLIRSATCDGVGNCPPEVQEICDDEVACTDNLCDPVGETCSHEANDNNCAPGLRCDLEDDCVPE